jgi:hypothetical protein
VKKINCEGIKTIKHLSFHLFSIRFFIFFSFYTYALSFNILKILFRMYIFLKFSFISSAVLFMCRNKKYFNFDLKLDERWKFIIENRELLKCRNHECCLVYTSCRIKFFILFPIFYSCCHSCLLERVNDLSKFSNFLKEKKLI